MENCACILAGTTPEDIMKNTKNKQYTHFDHPHSMCMLAGGGVAISDSQTNLLWFVDANRIPKFIKSTNLLHPRGMCASEVDNSLLICDSGHHRIKLVSFTCKNGKFDNHSSIVSTLAGSGFRGFNDGSVEKCTFYSPSDCSINPIDGNIIIADSGNHAIRQIKSSKIDPNRLLVETIAGMGHRNPGYKNGTNKEALFRSPMGVTCTDDGSIIVADTYNHTIRKISKSNICNNYSNDNGYRWKVTTVSGCCKSGHRDGHSGTALFYQPFGICVANDQSIYVVDKKNTCIRQIYSKNQEYWVRTIFIDELAPSRYFRRGKEPPFISPKGICVLSRKYNWYNDLDNSNNHTLGVCDPGNHLIRVISISQDHNCTDGNSQMDTSMESSMGALSFHKKKIINSNHLESNNQLIQCSSRKYIQKLRNDNKELRQQVNQYKKIFGNITTHLEHLVNIRVNKD